MATFGYEAVTRSGEEVKGSIEAESVDRAKNDLKARGMTVLEINEQNLLTRDISFQIGGYPKARDLSVMCRQFVSMSRAGVGILEVLKMLCDQTENKRLKEAMKGVRISVEKGETLAGSFALYPKIFPELMVNLVAAGEASGSLDVAMDRMAVQLERASKTRALVKKAMTYPLIVCSIAVVVVLVMLVVVVPTYAEMFEDLDATLPGITLFVMAVSSFVQSKWFILLPTFLLIAYFVHKFMKTIVGKRLLGKAALKIPVTKNLVVKTASAQMARTLSTLLGAGVPLVEAVEIVAGTMENPWFKDALLNAREEVVMGMPLSRPVEECGLFPPMVYHMMRIGEEAGSTEEMLDKLADYYEEEVELAVQTLMTALEPMFIVVLAVIVGFLIAACMAPMMKMYEVLDTL